MRLFRRTQVVHAIGPEVIRLPVHPTDEEIVAGVSRWLNLLSTNTFEEAVRVVHFTFAISGARLKQRLESFFGGSDHAHLCAITPSVLARTELYRESIPVDCSAVVGFFIPREDGMGIWTTFLVRKLGQECYLEFEILHA